MQQNSKTFADLGISAKTLKSLESKGFVNPTPIQEQAIPFLLTANQDLIGKAQTGTGKTAAFGIPIIDLLHPGQRNIQALILAPTRELAIQVSQEIQSFSQEKIKVLPIYGGQPIEKQISDIRRGVEIIVGTPGRVIDHLDRKTLDISQISFLVLDEADEMLNMGFIDDIEKILRKAPDNRRTILFSATMPPHIENLAKKYMNNYHTISVITNQKSAKNIEQIYYEVSSRDKFETLARIIDVETGFYGMVFCKTKIDTDEVAMQLNQKGFFAEALHGNVSQSQREKILHKFRNKKLNILVATDVAARGIDVENLTHVVNYSLPQDIENYVHRIGRTGRAGKNGIAISIISGSESRKLQQIQKAINQRIEKRSIPDVASLIAAKKSKITSLVLNNQKYLDNSFIFDLAREFIANFEGHQENLVANLLDLAFGDQLNSAKYHEISSKFSERSSDRDYQSSDRSSRAYSEDSSSDDSLVELFIAKGRNEDINEAKLAHFIAGETGLSAEEITQIKMFDQFSFFKTTPENASQILDVFQGQSGNGGKSLVTKAKGNNKKSQGGSGGYSSQSYSKSRPFGGGGNSSGGYRGGQRSDSRERGESRDFRRSGKR
jgi:ATP-dependent RNA helicase DeaD